MLGEARRRLASVSETPETDARALLARLAGKTPSWVLAHPEARLSPAEEDRLRQAIARLEAGEPLPYVLGCWEFYGLDFEVTPATLIPRPETELLVEQALAWLRAHPWRRQCADIGTGSGCIAIALAVHVPDLRVLATDLSLPALRVARRNAGRHAVAGRVAFALCRLFPPTRSRYDLVCANLPYVPTPILKGLQVYGKEPTLALDGGEEGLDLIEALLAEAPARLTPGGLLLAEIEAGQGPAARALAGRAFPEAPAQVLQDLAGRDRLLRIER